MSSFRLVRRLSHEANSNPCGLEHARTSISTSEVRTILNGGTILVEVKVPEAVGNSTGKKDETTEATKVLIINFGITRE